MTDRTRTQDSPIFVLGHRRSGTTMLRLMLASHPRIGIPPESGFAIALAWQRGTGPLRTPADVDRFVGAFLAHPESADWALGEASVRAALAGQLPLPYPAAVARIYRAYLAAKFPGKARWGDKTTGYEQHAPLLGRLFPDAQFIHLVRDPRGVLTSYREVPHLPREAATVAREWRSTVDALDRWTRDAGPTRAVTLRYEDLVAAPTRELTRLTTFLGEEFAEEMLDFGARNREGTLEPRRHLDWKRKTLEPVDPALADRWRAELPEADQRGVARIVGAALRRHGYDAEGAQTPRPDEALRSLAFDAEVRLRAALRPWKHRAKAELRRLGHG